jgi:hypothetical protein
MSTSRRRLDRRTAEQLLDGASAVSGDPLTGLLAAAAAPTRVGEQAGEHAAVAAFRAARLETAVQPRRPMRTTLLARLLTARIAAVAAALAVIVGGVATAAATGHLPTPLSGNPAPTGTSASSSTPSTPEHPTTTPADRGDDHGVSSPPQGTPSQSLTGLCNAYTAGAGSTHGKAPDNPAFEALATAAGGADKVDAYCAELLAGQRGQGHATDTAAPTTTTDPDPGHGQGHDPKGPPAGHPDPGPNHPTGSPTTHPGH